MGNMKPPKEAVTSNLISRVDNGWVLQCKHPSDEDDKTYHGSLRVYEDSEYPQSGDEVRAESLLSLLQECFEDELRRKHKGGLVLSYEPSGYEYDSTGHDESSYRYYKLDKPLHLHQERSTVVITHATVPKENRDQDAAYVTLQEIIDYAYAKRGTPVPD